MLTKGDDDYRKIGDAKKASCKMCGKEYPFCEIAKNCISLKAIDAIPSADVVPKELYDQAVSDVVRLSAEPCKVSASSELVLSSDICGDAISRADLQREILEEFGSEHEHDDTINTIYGMVINAPCVQPSRPKGEWIKHDEERDYCSVCKHIFKTRTLTKQDKWTTYVDDLGYNFCPNCGAPMIRGESDEAYNI